MRGLALILVFLAGSAQAMTPEDCRQIQSTLAKSIAALKELRLSPSVSQDGWCRVIDGPLGGGLEWTFQRFGTGFQLSLRQDNFAVDDLGPFEMTGQIRASDGTELEIGPFRLIADDRDRVVFSALFEATDDADGLKAETLSLSRSALTVVSGDSLVNEILAWAFRQDLTAARSSFITARDQRVYMLEWLDTEALNVIDGASAQAFKAFVGAYPQARGTAQITTREGQSVQVGGLIAAVLFGAPFSNSEAAQLVADAGLRFTWQPD